MKQKYNQHWKSFLVLLLGVISFQVHAQSDSLITITGKAVDNSTNDPLVGAYVIVKSGSDTTQTQRAEVDLDGNYVIKTKFAFPLILQISYLGYEPYRIEVYELPEGPLDLKLRSSSILNEVVVVGYGTRERKNLVGAVSKIDPKETTVIPVAGFDAQLQGQASGVQVNSQTGIPGDAVVVRVRGSGSINASADPLYIVDGVFINNESLSNMDLGGKATSPIADINPSDIESIEVLKDASATAIYGSRGANGVIIVTTKRGSYEQKPKITINSSFGWARAQKSRLWKLTTGPEFAALVNEAWINSGIDNPALNQTYANRPFRPASEVIAGVPGWGTPEEQQTYDRIGDLFRTGRLRSHDIGIQGGSKNTRYYLGGSYTSQEANIRAADYQRASFKINLDQRLNDKITVGTSNSVSYSNRDQVRSGTGTGTGIFQSALHTPTYQPKTNPDGTPSRQSPFDNLDVLINDAKLSTKSIRYIGNLYGEIEIIPRLKFRSSWSVDYNNYDENEYNTDRTLKGAATKGYAYTSLTQNSVWINEQTLSYRRAIAKNHNVGFLLGNTVQSNTQKFVDATGTGFPNNNYTQISSAGTRTATQTWTKSNLASFFTRADYNFKGKYFLEASLRADGSSKFGENNRWGYFPSVGAAWRIKEENFMKEVALISDLKIRSSFGILGNQNGIDNFAARGLWQGGANYPNTPGTADQPGTTARQIANPNLKWEKTRQFDVGLDVELLKERIGFSVDYYNKYTSDLLLPLPVPAITGFSTYFANSGELSNKGIEFALNTQNIKKKNFNWQTRFNITRNWNMIEKLETPLIYGSRDMVRNEEGYAMYSFWLYKQLYVDPQTGQAVFEDVNGDGQITVADRQILGNAAPKFFGGITNNFQFLGFDANVFFSYQYGNQVVSFDRILNEGGGTKLNNRGIFAYNLNRWQNPGDQTDVPRVTSVGNNYGIEQSSRFLEDGSFLRLKTVTIGYTIPKKLTEKFKIETARFYAVGANLWILTKYMGPDPEATHTAEQNARGIDVGTPPQPQSLQFGVNLTL